MYNQIETEYDLCETDEAQTKALLFNAPKLPEILREEIHSFAANTLLVTQGAEAITDAEILDALGISAVTQFGADVFYYLSSKLAQFDEVEPLAEVAAGITYLFGVTLQNAHNQVLEIEQKEVSIEDLLARIAEISKIIKEATADKDHITAADMAMELQQLCAELSKKTVVLQQTALKPSLTLS